MRRSAFPRHLSHKITAGMPCGMFNDSVRTASQRQKCRL
jgi:hypothetical protein